MGNTLNIAINTQAVILSKLYKRPILASFHGMWSLAGFAGAAVGAILIALNKSIAFHYAIIFGLNLFLSLFVFRYLLASDKSKTESSQPIFTLPDRSLLVLGLIAFCSMLIEGTMFDWTGVYFKNIVQAPPQWVGMGYVAFMISMAAMRFVADKMTLVYGVKTIIMVSGMLSFIGLSLVILFPVIITSLVGFLIVGVGVSSVIPLVFAAAGNTTKMAPSAALASVSSMGFFGFLIGPPVVGFMAEAFGLQFSFAVIAFIGLFTVLLASRIRQV
jgi:Na+/melibiose symporter-like transporter